MGALDKDRFQKQLAIRYCLARGMVPFPEVLVPSLSDISESLEVLTDLDVLGLEFVSDGDLRRFLFDCKTGSKLSAISRAFWARGVMTYTSCDHGYILLKSKAVSNHRLSSLSIDVDLHTEDSFVSVGKTLDLSFPRENYYQSSIDAWNEVDLCYSRNSWSSELRSLVRNVVPLASSPASVFRRVIAELRSGRGNFDPGKKEHVVVFLDAVASLMVLWASLARDARRFYLPGMAKDEFEKILRLYLWGGRDAYKVRQQLQKDRAGSDSSSSTVVDFPAWDKLVSYFGVVIDAPQETFKCAHFCREVAFREVSSPQPLLDAELSSFVSRSPRAKQFSVGLVDYLIQACGLPRDLGKAAESRLLVW
ncbi:hypothetical protein [Xanthomonas campestris]|uniref:Uncharacterized protein n=1 Tax=Xanthomonas campestris pv. papavericola TaxID=487881 RepID=A0AAJ2X163_XANCA|nr:hypothetical protein [Xanthomonas campestris]MEC3886930.1 hypothetical protein [Xanthomonas campestris pv. papavericola]